MEKLFEEMTYQKINLGNKQALLITSSILKQKIYKRVIELLTVTPPQQPLVNETPIDEINNSLLDIIRMNTVLQNPHILCCIYWNDSPCSFLITKESGNIHLIWQRFDETVFKGTIFDGFFLIDDKYYSPLSWSIEHFKLPPPPQIDNDDVMSTEKRNSSNGNSNSNSSGQNDCNSARLVIDGDIVMELKEKATELMNPDEFIKARMPRQAKRQVRCKFFIRMLFSLCGNICNSQTATYDLTIQLNNCLEQKFIDDSIYNNCDIISWLDQVWAYECDLNRSHLNTVLYKPIPYGLLHGGLVEERIRGNPLINSTIDFGKFANFQLKYYGPDKPCVYNLCAMDPTTNQIVVYDTAHIPTVECQQYIVCILRKQSGNQKNQSNNQMRVIVRCVLETKLRKWIPIHHLLKAETKIITTKMVENLMLCKKENNLKPDVK